MDWDSDRGYDHLHDGDGPGAAADGAPGIDYGVDLGHADESDDGSGVTDERVDELMALDEVMGFEVGEPTTVVGGFEETDEPDETIAGATEPRDAAAASMPPPPTLRPAPPPLAPPPVTSVPRQVPGIAEVPENTRAILYAHYKGGVSTVMTNATLSSSAKSPFSLQVLEDRCLDVLRERFRIVDTHVSFRFNNYRFHFKDLPIVSLDSMVQTVCSDVRFAASIVFTPPAADDGSLEHSNSGYFREQFEVACASARRRADASGGDPLPVALVSMAVFIDETTLQKWSDKKSCPMPITVLNQQLGQQDGLNAARFLATYCPSLESFSGVCADGTAVTAKQMRDLKASRCRKLARQKLLATVLSTLTPEKVLLINGVPHLVRAVVALGLADLPEISRMSGVLYKSCAWCLSSAGEWMSVGPPRTVPGMRALSGAARTNAKLATCADCVLWPLFESHAFDCYRGMSILDILHTLEVGISIGVIKAAYAVIAVPARPSVLQQLRAWAQVPRICEAYGRLPTFTDTDKMFKESTVDALPGNVKHWLVIFLAFALQNRDFIAAGAADAAVLAQRYAVAYITVWRLLTGHSIKSEATAAGIVDAVRELHACAREVLGDETCSITPKLHVLVHAVEFIERYGSLLLARLAAYDKFHSQAAKAPYEITGKALSPAAEAKRMLNLFYLTAMVDSVAFLGEDLYNMEHSLVPPRRRVSSHNARCSSGLLAHVAKGCQWPAAVTARVRDECGGDGRAGLVYSVFKEAAVGPLRADSSRDIARVNASFRGRAVYTHLLYLADDGVTYVVEACAIVECLRAKVAGVRGVAGIVGICMRARTTADHTNTPQWDRGPLSALMVEPPRDAPPAAEVIWIPVAHYSRCHLAAVVSCMGSNPPCMMVVGARGLQLDARSDGLRPDSIGAAPLAEDGLPVEYVDEQ